MDSNEAMDEFKIMVLSDLAEIYKKLSRKSDISEETRDQVDRFVAEFNSLVPYAHMGNASKHAQAEQLLSRMALFLPRIVGIESKAAGSSSL
jgi:hypothetical protein